MTTATTTPLLAFHGDKKIKQKYLTRVRDHRKADEIRQGYGYWKRGKGCAVGCTLHSDEPYCGNEYEVQLGIPLILGRLEDRIFEGLPADLAKTWPERFLEAAEVGADLSMVWPKFAHWLLVDPEAGVIKFAKTDKRRKAIQDVADLYQRWINGSKPPLEEWRLARTAAAAAYAAASAAAAAYAAYAAAAAASAADADAYADADAAAYDAAYAAAAAADAAAAAADADADAYAADARKKFFALASEKLVTLMAEAPVVK